MSKGEKTVVLFLGANPSTETHLALPREVQRIDDRLRQTEYRDQFELIQQWETSAFALPGKIMRFKPQIVHFSGHGSPYGELIFQNQNGKGIAADADAVRDVFRILREGLTCVVLNACFSEAQARAIAEFVPAVVGMNQAVGDEDAITFAGAFYEALGYGRSVKDAFELGKAGISLRGLRDGDVPVLLLQEGIDADDLFLHGDRPEKEISSFAQPT